MKYKYIGKLKPKIAKECKIIEHINKPILVYEDRIEHVKMRHMKDFGGYKNIMFSYNHLSEVINNPDYYYYNKKSGGLEYYKKLKNNLCVIVRINPGHVLKIKSWYPANNGKIANRKHQKNNELNMK